jgi:hypothetical protein
MGDKPVRVQDALAAPAIAGGVPDRDRPVMAHGVGDGEQDRGVRYGSLAGGSGEGQRAEHGIQPAGKPVGQYPADLGRRGLAGRAGGQSGPAARDQTEQHGQCLVVAEHERRHAVSGGEPVSTVAAAHRLDRYVEVDQVGRVPAHGALVDLKPIGELGDRPDAAGLQQLQQ